MSARPSLAAIAAALAEAGVPDPEDEARALLRFARDDPARLADALARRIRRVPLDRIEGRRGFWTLDLALGPDTLSPRPDTETVVAAALDRLGERDLTERDGPAEILDLGTGSGAILLAILAERPGDRGLGIDRSPGAIEIARANAAAVAAARGGDFARRARFEVGDWCEGLGGAFDLVVSNPPYIPSDEIAGLEPEVRGHDPILALDGGADGLCAYRAILAGVGRVLRPRGALVFEIGIGQREAVDGLAAAAGFALLEARRDLGGIERALVFAHARP